MKILSIISAFPPHYYGGGEISAVNLMQVMRSYGHEVGVVTIADKGEPLMHGDIVDGTHIWRLPFPRPYAYWNHVKAPKWLKPLWYLQDHFDPRNRALLASVLDSFKPDCVLIHVPAGIGYNSLREIGKKNIAAVYFLHDLNLVCLWGGMFRNGKTCQRQCRKCRAVSAIRFRAVSSIRRLGFCSPSRANLKRVASIVPLDRYKSTSIFNANSYPVPTVQRRPSASRRFLYVGRLHYTKGVDIILGALERLAARYSFTIDILGEGADGPVWRERFGKYDWCRFHGHVTQQAVSDFMVQSDVLLVPSIWEEPLGGVVVQALMLGTPVFGSSVGGIPELIEHDKNGLLLPPRNAGEWEKAMEMAINDATRLDQWGRYALDSAKKFDPDVLGRKIEAFVKDVVTADAT